MLLFVFCDAQGNEPTISPKGIFVGVVFWVFLDVFVLSWSIRFTSSANRVRSDLSKELLVSNSEMKDIPKLRAPVIYKRIIADYAKDGGPEVV